MLTGKTEIDSTRVEIYGWVDDTIIIQAQVYSKYQNKNTEELKQKTVGPIRHSVVASKYTDDDKKVCLQRVVL